MESFYTAALCRELDRADIPADETVILEIKAVPAHDMQLQTYPRMSGRPVGLLLNFHTLRLKDGLRRFVG